MFTLPNGGLQRHPFESSTPSCVLLAIPSARLTLSLPGPPRRDSRPPFPFRARRVAPIGRPLHVATEEARETKRGPGLQGPAPARPPSATLRRGAQGFARRASGPRRTGRRRDHPPPPPAPPLARSSRRRAGTASPAPLAPAASAPHWPALSRSSS